MTSLHAHSAGWIRECIRDVDHEAFLWLHHIDEASPRGIEGHRESRRRESKKWYYYEIIGWNYIAAATTSTRQLLCSYIGDSIHGHILFVQFQIQLPGFTHTTYFHWTNNCPPPPEKKITQPIGDTSIVYYSYYYYSEIMIWSYYVRILNKKMWRLLGSSPTIIDLPMTADFPSNPLTPPSGIL